MLTKWVENNNSTSLFIGEHRVGVVLIRYYRTISDRLRLLLKEQGINVKKNTLELVNSDQAGQPGVSCVYEWRLDMNLVLPRSSPKGETSSLAEAKSRVETAVSDWLETLPLLAEINKERNGK